MKTKAQKVIEKFMNHWVIGEYLEMLELTQKTWKLQNVNLIKNELKTSFPTIYESFDVLPEMKVEQINRLKRLLPQNVSSYKIEKINKHSEFIYDAVVLITISEKEQMKEQKRIVERDVQITKKVTARLLCELEPYKPSIDGEFGVNPISVIRNLY